MKYSYRMEILNKTVVVQDRGPLQQTGNLLK
jgi:hypothetical protein